MVACAHMEFIILISSFRNGKTSCIQHTTAAELLFHKLTKITHTRTSKNIFRLQKEARLWNMHMWWVPSWEENRLQATPLSSRWFQFQASSVCILSAMQGWMQCGGWTSTPSDIRSSYAGYVNSMIQFIRDRNLFDFQFGLFMETHPYLC